MSKTHIMYPTREVQFTRENHQIYKRKDYIGFVCPECYNSMVFKTSVTLNIKSIDEDKDTEEKHIAFIEPLYNIQCTKCGKTHVYNKPLDPNITPIIATLNRKGYETLYSCEGHQVNNEEWAHAYITFKHIKQKPICDIYPLPSPWYLEGSEDDPTDWDSLSKDNDCRYYYNHRDHFIIRAVNSTPVRERMAALRRWANTLPYCFSTVFNTSILEREENVKDELNYLDERLSPEDITPSREYQNENKNLNLVFTYDPNADNDEDDLEEVIRRAIDNHMMVNFQIWGTNESDLRYQYSSIEEIKHRADPEWSLEREKAEKEAKIAKFKEEREEKRRQKQIQRQKHKEQKQKLAEEKRQARIDAGLPAKYTKKDRIPKQKLKEAYAKMNSNRAKKNNNSNDIHRKNTEASASVPFYTPAFEKQMTNNRSSYYKKNVIKHKDNI